MTSVVKLELIQVAQTTSSVVIPIAQLVAPIDVTDPERPAIDAEVFTTDGSDQESTFAVPPNPNLYGLRVVLRGDTDIDVTVGQTATAANGKRCLADGTYEFSLAGATVGAVIHFVDVA